MVEVSDVIIQVLDARDPLACRRRRLSGLSVAPTRISGYGLLLNKIDLAPKENVQAWLKYFREEMPCVAFMRHRCDGTGKHDAGLSRASPPRAGYGGKDAARAPAAAAAEELRAKP